MEKLANHIALQSIVEGGMEKKALGIDAVGALIAAMGGAGAAGAAIGSEDHKTLSGILGVGTGFGGGILTNNLIDATTEKLYSSVKKVKNPKLKAALAGLANATIAATDIAGSAGAGYGTGKFVDWLADKIG